MNWLINSLLIISISANCYFMFARNPMYLVSTIAFVLVGFIKPIPLAFLASMIASSLAICTSQMITSAKMRNLVIFLISDAMVLICFSTNFGLTAILWIIYGISFDRESRIMTVLSYGSFLTFALIAMGPETLLNNLILALIVVDIVISTSALD